MKNILKHPCEDCLMVPICKNNVLETNGISNLCYKCSILNTYLSDSKDTCWLDKFLLVRDFFKGVDKSK